jgi:hypothetical protein
MRERDREGERRKKQRTHSGIPEVTEKKRRRKEPTEEGEGKRNKKNQRKARRTN